MSIFHYCSFAVATEGKEGVPANLIIRSKNISPLYHFSSPLPTAALKSLFKKLTMNTNLPILGAAVQWVNLDPLPSYAVGIILVTVPVETCTNVT